MYIHIHVYIILEVYTRIINSIHNGINIHTYVRIYIYIYIYIYIPRPGGCGGPGDQLL